MKSQLLRRAARRRDDEDVVVAITIRGERDPLSIRREGGIDIARLVHREPLEVAAVFIRHPDVAEIAERHLAGVIRGMAQQFDFTEGGDREEEQKKNRELFHTDSCEELSFELLARAFRPSRSSGMTCGDPLRKAEYMPPSAAGPEFDV